MKRTILLDIDLKIILSDHQNNADAPKNFDILAVSLSVLHNYNLFYY